MQSHFHSQYQSLDFYLLFHSILLKPISTCFLAIEIAMLQISSKVYQYTLEKKTNSLAYTRQKNPILINLYR